MMVINIRDKRIIINVQIRNTSFLECASKKRNVGVDGSASSGGQEKYALASLGLRLR